MMEVVMDSMNNTVKSVDVFSGPIGSYGFRSGRWTATMEDGRKFTFYGSIPHCDGLNEERLIGIAQQAIDNKLDNVIWI